MIYFKNTSAVSELPDMKGKIPLLSSPSLGFSNMQGQARPLTVTDVNATQGIAECQKQMRGWPCLHLGSWALMTLAIFIVIKTAI